MASLVLDVFLEGVPAPIGQLSRHEDGSVSFRYSGDASKRPISLSLPFREEAHGDAVTRAFFSNLLFENAQRDQIMQRHGLDFSDVVGLLYHLGADCPGAISCVPHGAGPTKHPGHLGTDYTELDADELHHMMRSLRDHRRVPGDTADPSPLAGVQGKVAVTRLPGGGLALPRPDVKAPTTHILKVPRRLEMMQADHEHILMALMSKVQGHPVARTEILGEGDLKGLLIERFDRIVDDQQVRRVHQEDFCQAMGLGPHLKYQRNGRGAHVFDAAAIGAVLQQTDNPGLARQAFLEITLVNLLVGNTDNHAKNHALLYHGSRPVLAPVYDVVPIVIDPQVTHQLAFDIGSARVAEDIGAKDLAAFLAQLGYPRMTPALRKRMQAIVADIVAMVGDMNGPAKKRLGDAIAAQAAPIASALGMDIEIPERDLVPLNRS